MKGKGKEEDKKEKKVSECKAEVEERQRMGKRRGYVSVRMKWKKDRGWGECEVERDV